jgi:hypothetical protein
MDVDKIGFLFSRRRGREEFWQYENAARRLLHRVANSAMLGLSRRQDSSFQEARPSAGFLFEELF